MNILVVDDEPTLLNLTKIVLKAKGHSVATANDGAEALVAVEKSSTDFDLILTDHDMPKVHGLELVRQLNESDFHGEVVVWSGSLNTELREHYKSLGVRQCLSKPVSAAALSEMVEELADELAA